MSKFFRNMYKNTLYTFKYKHKLTTSLPLGLLKHISTSSAPNILTDFIYKPLNSKENKPCIWFDLGKAFDTVTLIILTDKLVLCGVRHKAPE